MKVIVFSAVWCGQCKVYHPIIEEFCKENNLELIEKDADSDKDEDLKLMDELKIRSLPTTVIMDGDKVKKILYGIQQKDKLKEVLL